jgi:beta-lactam-binding protein with PASTA domain
MRRRQRRKRIEGRRVKSFFRFVLLALILLIVALVSAVTAMRIAIHGREVAVPALVDRTPTEARRIAELEGFQFEVERQYYSGTIPAGKIISQLPAAGTLIRRGWQIRVAESLGPQRVEIPNVLGESERAAEFNIRRRGLDVGAVSEVEMPSTAADRVVAQNPTPGASGVTTPKISLLTVEAAPPQTYVMPSFSGQTLGSVTAILKDAGLQLGTVHVTAPDTGNAPPASVSPPQTTSPVPPASPSSVVVSQNPAAGSKVQVGSAVNFEVR